MTHDELMKEIHKEKDRINGVIGKLRAEVEDLNARLDGSCKRIGWHEKERDRMVEHTKDLEGQVGELAKAARGLMEKVEARCEKYNAPVFSEHARARNLGQHDVLYWLLNFLGEKHITDLKPDCPRCGSGQHVGAHCPQKDGPDPAMPCSTPNSREDEMSEAIFKPCQRRQHDDCATVNVFDNSRVCECPCHKRRD